MKMLFHRLSRPSRGQHLPSQTPGVLVLPVLATVFTLGRSTRACAVIKESAWTGAQSVWGLGMELVTLPTDCLEAARVVTIVETINIAKPPHTLLPFASLKHYW